MSVNGVGGASSSGAASGRAPGGSENTVWRGDTRGPDDIFNNGFQPRESGRDVPANRTSLEEHVNGERVGPWVSTATSHEVAEDFAGPNGWIYQIDRPQNAVDVNKELGINETQGYGEEREIAVPGGIPNTDVQRAWHLDRVGRVELPYRDNPNYRPAEPVDPPPPIPPNEPPHDELRK